MGRNRIVPAAGLGACLLAIGITACSADTPSQTQPSATQNALDDSPTSDQRSVAQGKEIFRFDTFGDEQYWTDTLRMHEVIEQGVTPVAALSVGLKVDVEALPSGLRELLAAGKVDLKSTATTVALLKLNAVVGARGVVQKVEGRDRLVRFGVTCALCHSTVDNSFAPGIGRRLDGWPNRDLNPGAIVALSPAVNPTTKAVLNTWGAGKYDPRFNIDGLSTPLVLPPAYGLRGVAKETYTAEGPISYWNAYVAVTQMHGHGSFSDPRLGINIVQSPDLVTPKLPALRAYQLSLRTPRPPLGTFDQVAAARGRDVFTGAGRCATCHLGPHYTDVNLGRLHLPSETNVDPRYAARTSQKQYRTTPLRALWQHAPYFHDGSAATLEDVVRHYIGALGLQLSTKQQHDLVEYLKSL